MQTQHVYIETQRENLRILIQSSSFDSSRKEDLLQRLELLQTTRVWQLCNAADKPLTATNIRYILTFLINMSVPEIATLFNVDTSSVYTVRYRIRKLFPKEMVLPL